MSKETGGSAFPILKPDYHNTDFSGIDPGMTLRDYFAAKAMQSILTNENELQRVRNHYNEANQIPAIASMSYRMADAMIEARKYE